MLGGAHGRACRGHDSFCTQRRNSQGRQTRRQLPGRAVAVLSFLLLAAPATADGPAASGIHDVPPFSHLMDMVARVSANAASTADKRCVIGGGQVRELERFLGMAAMQAGFPNAAPAPVYLDPPQN